jgi:hypothetical protein
VGWRDEHTRTSGPRVVVRDAIVFGSLIADRAAAHRTTFQAEVAVGRLHCFVFARLDRASGRGGADNFLRADTPPPARASSGPAPTRAGRRWPTSRGRHSRCRLFRLPPQRRAWRAVRRARCRTERPISFTVAVTRVFPERGTNDRQPEQRVVAELGHQRSHGAGIAARAFASSTRLTTAKKNPVDHPHIRMPVSASIAPTSRHSTGSSRSP